CPYQQGQVFEQITIQLSQGENAGENSGKKHHQKIAIYGAPIWRHAFATKYFQGAGIDGSQPSDNFVISTTDKGPGATASTGNHIGSAHGDAFDKQQGVITIYCHGAESLSAVYRPEEEQILPW